jgi:hypothetical protein
LVVLTWLQQVQKYFFDKKSYEYGDWSKRGKYCGTTSNKLKDTAPLANINFCKFYEQHVLKQITNVTEFKPLEDKKGVFTSLEEWALRIFKPKQEFQLNDLFDPDDDTKQHWNRIAGNVPPLFEITDKDFTTQADIDSGTKTMMLYL